MDVISEGFIYSVTLFAGRKGGFGSPLPFDPVLQFARRSRTG